jgi:hypothetical protein
MWEGPYIVKTKTAPNAYRLTSPSGEDLEHSWNIDVTPGFKEQIWVHLICAPRKNNTHNNTVHRDKCHKYHKCTYYIAEVLQK